MPALPRPFVYTSTLVRWDFKNLCSFFKKSLTTIVINYIGTLSREQAILILVFLFNIYLAQNGCAINVLVKFLECSVTSQSRDHPSH